MATSDAGFNQSKMHPVASTGFSASGASGLYDRARPSYPSEALEAISSHLPAQNVNVVELGSGTGIFTRCLLSPSSPTSTQITHLTAVEPSLGMREGFKAAVGEMGMGRLECVDGSFDCIPGGRGVDLVVAAQAYHWIGKDVGFQEECVREAGRVLKPGGVLALIWNLKDRDAAKWVADLRDAYEVYESDTPQYRRGLWRTLFDTPAFKSTFTLLPTGSPCTSESAQPTLAVKRVEPTTLEGVKERVLSKSYISCLGEDQQKKVVERIEEIWKRGEGLKWVEGGEGVTGEFPYVTDLYLMKKK